LGKERRGESVKLRRCEEGRGRRCVLGDEFDPVDAAKADGVRFQTNEIVVQLGYIIINKFPSYIGIHIGLEQKIKIVEVISP